MAKAIKTDKTPAPARKAPAASIPNLDDIVEFAKQQVALEKRIAKGEELLSELRKQHTKISMEDLPTAMFEAKLKEFTLSSGERIEIKEDFSVGISVANRPAAFGWLEKHGYGAMIKCEVSVLFGKGELEKAQKLALELGKKKITAQVTRDVHWQTLKSFVKESVQQARPIPMDLFGAIGTNRAKITAPKSK